jgi:hypothetical protein
MFRSLNSSVLFECVHILNVDFLWKLLFDIFVFSLHVNKFWVCKRDRLHVVASIVITLISNSIFNWIYKILKMHRILWLVHWCLRESGTFWKSVSGPRNAIKNRIHRRVSDKMLPQIDEASDFTENHSPVVVIKSWLIQMYFMDSSVMFELLLLMKCLQEYLGNFQSSTSTTKQS